MKGKNSYNVPDGYFASLEDRLGEIPRQEAGTWQRVRPYLALAAAFAAVVTIGTAILRLTASPATDDWADDFAIAQLQPATAPDALFDSSLAESLAPTVTYDDIAQYLIETGVTIEELEDYETDY